LTLTFGLFHESNFNQSPVILPSHRVSLAGRPGAEVGFLDLGDFLDHHQRECLICLENPP
jgi:hypothetical protein